MSKFKPMSRRSFIQGTGALIALPWLEAMMPNTAHAQMAAPLRLLNCYFPYGIHGQGFAPTTFGNNFAIPEMLTSIAPYKSRVVLTKGLGLYSAPPGMAHYNALSTFMTGPRISGACDGGQLKVGNPSAGYKISQFLRASNPTLKHMYIGNQQCQTGGDFCDGAGGPNAVTKRYTDKFEWSNQTSPLSQTLGPQAVFDALFAGVQPGAATDPLVAFRRSRGLGVLDSTLQQQASLIAQLGSSDKQKMDQYFTGIREAEKTLQAASVQPAAPVCSPGQRPAGTLRYDVELKVFMDLIALAFACDRSRVISYTLDNETSGYRTFDFLGINQVYHDLSHWYEGADRLPLFLKGNRFYGDQLGYLLGKLASYKEGDKDLLYNSIIVYGSGHTDGGHGMGNLPIVIAGEGGGRVKTGQALDLSRVTMQNLYLTIMQKFGMPDTQHGDSTGTIAI
jgi:hypothetical protein